MPIGKCATRAGGGILVRGRASVSPGVVLGKIEGLDPVEMGAWTGVCSVVLNLHEFITRD